jgi:predicted nucleotidyltransferase component of viral defense system
MDVRLQKYVVRQQKRISGLVTNKFTDYYLTGGTALAFYFKHRYSEDLDFFTQKYDFVQVKKVAKYIEQNTGFSCKLEARQNKRGLIPMAVYSLILPKGLSLKVDFVQDYALSIKPIKKGLHSIEDIYYHKLVAATGISTKVNEVGRSIPSGRQAAKDLFDIYYLSNRYSKLSEFFLEYFSYDSVERLMGWYVGFDRIELKLELARTAPKVNTATILRHLDSEIMRKLPEKIK